MIDEYSSVLLIISGIAVEPTEGKLYAPCDGRVDSVFDTKHAINILSAEGAEVLLHIGIDTVKLGGKHFVAFSAQTLKNERAYDIRRTARRFVGFSGFNVAAAVEFRLNIVRLAAGVYVYFCSTFDVCGALCTRGSVVYDYAYL